MKINIKELQPGDLIRHVVTGEANIVIHQGDVPIAMRAISITNRSKWETCNPANLDPERFLRAFEMKLMGYNVPMQKAEAFIKSLRALYEDPCRTQFLRNAQAAIDSIL